MSLTYCAFVFEDDEKLPTCIGSYSTEKEACQSILSRAIDGPFDYSRFLNDAAADSLDDFYNLDDAVVDCDSLDRYMEEYAPSMKYLVFE